MLLPRARLIRNITADQTNIQKAPATRIRLPQNERTAQKGPYVRKNVLEGVAKRKRSHSCFRLDTLVVIKVNVAINHGVCFTKRLWFMTINAFCLEDGEEVFSHGIVVRVTAS